MESWKLHEFSTQLCDLGFKVVCDLGHLDISEPGVFHMQMCLFIFKIFKMRYSIETYGQLQFQVPAWGWGQGRREVCGTVFLGETPKDGERNLCFGYVKHPGPQVVQVRCGRLESPLPKIVTIKDHLILGLGAAIGVAGGRELAFPGHLLGHQEAHHKQTRITSSP